MNAVESIIQKTILEMDKPFLMSELFEKLFEVGITDGAIILDVLDQLLNSGLVSYSDIQDDMAVYCSAFASTCL